jgi:hypothetical protein
VIFIVAICIVDGVLGLISRWIDHTFLLFCPFVSGTGERKVEQGLLLPNGPPGPLRFTPCPQRGFAIGTGKSGDRRESTSRVEEATGKLSQWRFGCLPF